jgi:O-methyltransferase
LRLDTDDYASTRAELEALYPKLTPGGVLMIDDYGHFRGARRATDEFLEGQPRVPLLHRVSYAVRSGVKPTAS